MNSFFVVLSICLLAAVLLLLIKFAERSKALDSQVYREHWRKIETCLDDEAKYQLAVIEADKLLDKAFKERGFRGQTMGERLVFASKHLSNKDDVWQAHKLRNRLVHEMGVQLTLKQTRRVLNIFARALKDVGALRNE